MIYSKGNTMKKFIALAVLIGASLVPFTATAASHKPSYCGTTPYDVAYAAVYNYPTGSYWVTQINQNPAYYAKHNAQYQAEYGCN